MRTRSRRSSCSTRTSHSRCGKGSRRRRSSSMDRKKSRAYLSYVVAAGFALRAIGLARESYWFDELLSLELAGKPCREIVRLLATRDVHPPLFFVLLRGVRLVLGTSEL